MQFLYVLNLIPHLLDNSNWTDTDHSIVDEHFKHLQDLQASGILIMAGRTDSEDEANFGIVVFKGHENDAKKIMLSDPAIKAGIMTGKLYPYRVALLSENNI